MIITGGEIKRLIE